MAASRKARILGENRGQTTFFADNCGQSPLIRRSRHMAAAADPIVITSVARTPIGGMQGQFSGLAATQLGAIAVKAAVERSGLKPEDVDEVILGCVLPAGQGQ